MAELRILNEAEIDEPLRQRLLELTSDDPGSDMHQFLLPSASRNYAWVILAEDAGTVLGWAAVYGAVRWRLYLDVFVDPAHRGRGIGRSLLDAARSLNSKSTLLSDTPFYRHVAPDLVPLVRDGIALLRMWPTRSPDRC